MKALLIIIACVALSLVLKVIDLISSRKINSVGAKSNMSSIDMPRININDEKELKEALDYYKDLAD